MNPIEARRRAEKSFKHPEHKLDRQCAIPGYEVEAATVRGKTARLKALRLANERSGIPADRWPSGTG
jgi:hypothetical protein